MTFIRFSFFHCARKVRLDDDDDDEGSRRSRVHLEDGLATTVFLIKLLFDQGDLSLPRTRERERADSNEISDCQAQSIIAI